MVKMKIKWDEAAKNSLHEIIAYIKKDSVQNAENVKQTILKAIREIPSHPERYPADKFKKNNNGSYRAFEIYHIRIAYKTESDAIKIIRIRSTRQEPLGY